MQRRYNRWHARFSQPDPYGGSYDLTDPQSLNRYPYTRNDPINFTDPTGLDVSADGSFTCQPGQPCEIGSINVFGGADSLGAALAAAGLGRGEAPWITEFEPRSSGLPVIGVGGGPVLGDGAGAQQHTPQYDPQKYRDCINRAAAERKRRDREIAKMGESVLPGVDDIVPAILAGVGTGVAAARTAPEPRTAGAAFLGAAAGSIGWSLVAVPAWKGLKNVDRRMKAYNESSRIYYREMALCAEQHGYASALGSW